MTASRLMRVGVAIGLALSAAWLGACSASSSSTVTSPTTLARFDTGERATGLAVDGSVSAVAGAYNRALASQASPTQLGVTDTPGVRGVVLQAIVPAGCEGATIRYFNAQGQEQTAYNPTTTTRITAKGPCSTVQGVVTLDVTVDDMQASSSTMLINGTASGIYEGNAVNGTITNVRMSKQFCGAPSGGVILAALNQLTVTIRFDGSLNATATYTWNGATVTFAIPMKAC